MNKGQSALEFLVTYGWAFLVILIMIGALSYFGVMDPARYLPDYCILGSGFTCVDSRMQTSGFNYVVDPNDPVQAAPINGAEVARLWFRNDMGMSLVIQDITQQPQGIPLCPALTSVMIGDIGAPQDEFVKINLVENTKTIASNEILEVIFFCHDLTAGAQINQRTTVNVAIKYNRLSSNLIHTVDGRMVGVVG